MVRPVLIQIFLALALAGAVRAAPAGLVHHWNFDEGPDWHDSAFGSMATNTMALDSVGTAHATLQNMAGTNWVSGRQFTAFEFDGVNQHLAVATNLALSLGDTASLSFWLRTTQTGAVSAATAPGIVGVVGAGGAQWAWLDDVGRIALSVDNTLVVRSTNAVNDGRWHHVVLTRNATNGAGQFYVDGLGQGAATGPTGWRGASFTSLARIENGATPKYFKGRLDQVHVFNRILSSADVATLRTNHAPKCWNITTEGVNNRPFTTASIFARTYDVERDAVSVTRWTQPEHGTVTHNGDGSFTYTATGGFIGSDSFAVTVGDGNGGFHTASMKVTLMSEPPGGGGVPVTQFTNFAALQANGTNLSHSGWRIPRAMDWNGDGKFDLLIGAGGYVWRYLNISTTSAPVFATGVKVQAAGVDINTGDGSAPIALMDMTGDGVKDLIVTGSSSKLRVYRNTAASNATPVYAAYVNVKQTNGTTDFILPDRRFDLGDWNGDGKPDLITGAYSGNIQLFRNTGTAADPRFGTGTTLFSDSYNIYPRLFDLNGNGLVDLLRGINWGDIRYWRDAGSRGLVNSTTLGLTDTNGTNPDLHSLTDGAMVDFGDFNGDGILDLLVGGHSSDKIYLAYGARRTIAQSLAEIEAIYNVDTNHVGVTLSANTNALLDVVNDANGNLIAHLQNGTLGTREALFTALTNHIGKYGFLKYQNLNTTNFHHVPSIVLQNWVMLEYSLADTPTRRTNIANVMGLTGTMRTIFLETGLALGDNGMSVPATYGTIRDFQRRHPRELFPDAILTTDQLYSDGRGGFVWTPNSTKNTFGQWALGSANEWAGDLTAAIQKVLGAGAASGDYFTFVMGHEVTHSLDGYVNSRANADLRKRWGLMLCTAAGPDVIPGANGWRDWTLTKSNFQAKGYWDGVSTNWTPAWSNYWAVGYGSQFKELAFMRFDISWFLDNSQESLATQANHHWANGVGRLIGAADRFRRATTTGLPPLKANINEVVTFIDFLSAGMNRVNLVETKYQSSPQQVNWIDHYADLERDDRGYIRRLSVDGRSFTFEVHTNGVVTNVFTSMVTVENDEAWALRDQAARIDVVANDTRFEGGTPPLAGFTPPAHGVVSSNADGTLLYTPAPGYTGSDAFNYFVSDGSSVVATGAVSVTVIDPITDSLPLVAADASWSYNQTANLDGVAWTAPNYDDSAWPQGPATLGVETAALPEVIRTTLTLGRTTYYFRTRFVLPPGLPLGGLNAAGLIDDGAAVCLNGVEVARVRLAATNITYDSLATNGPPPASDVTGWESIAIPASALTSGTNVLAVEVHQVTNTSSDIVFNLRLSTIPAGPQLTVFPTHLTRAPGEFAVFTAAGLGAEPLRWQWFRNGIALPAETNATLSLASVAWADAAVYHVQLTNTFGQAASQPARLTVWANPGPQTLIPLAGAWRYNQTQNLDGTGWMNPNYTDGSWPLSNALLYVESAALPGPKNTLLTLGRTTYYFRGRFNFSPELAASLVASNLIDDGAVVWLNGQEAARIRFTNGVPRYTNFASAQPLSGDVTNFDVVTLPMTNVFSGSNVIAVEVHQASFNSSDIVFGLSLTALPPGPVAITSDPVSLTVPYGQAAQFTVAATGPGTLRYQWLKNGIPLPAQTNVALSFTAATTADSASYQVLVSNAVSAVASRPAILTVLPPPQPPALGFRLDGGGSQFTVTTDTDTVIVQAATNLGLVVAWTDIATNPPGRSLALPITGNPQQFFRLKLP